MQNKENLPSVIYTNNCLVKLYAVSLTTFMLSVFVFCAIFSNLDNLFSEWDSKFMGIFLIIFTISSGNILFLCMLWLSGKYVLKIENAEEGFINIKIWSLLRVYKTRKYPKTLLENAKYYVKKSEYHEKPFINATYLKLKTPEGKKLIVDAQGDFN